jgi:hypothetical protein
VHELPNPSRKVILLHRFILGSPPKGMEIDHIDCDGLNNQKRNLRFVIHRDNMLNSRRFSKDFPGTILRKDHPRWEARINVFGKRVYLGCYSTKEEASKAYVDYIKKNIPESILSRGD